MESSSFRLFRTHTQTDRRGEEEKLWITYTRCGLPRGEEEVKVVGEAVEVGEDGGRESGCC